MPDRSTTCVCCNKTINRKTERHSTYQAGGSRPKFGCMACVKSGAFQQFIDNLFRVTKTRGRF